MAYRVFRTFFACVGLAGAALIATADIASARPGGAGVAAAPGSRGVASAHAMMRPHGVGGFRHRGRFGGGVYWPGYDGYGYGSNGEPVGEAAPPPTSNDAHYTYTYDVPWDWAHRYPPNVVPSAKPYVSSCPTESVTVPGRGGEHTVNITRCY
jgi:hypothetical protein